MASTNKTPHLGLCQWEATDPFLREDFNQDFARIDEAIGGMSRVKLFDVTVTESLPSVQLDFTQIDIDQFAMLEIFFDLAMDGKYMRINGIDTDAYRFFYSHYNPTPTDRFVIGPGYSTLSISACKFVHHYDNGSNIESLPKTRNDKLNTLNFFATGENSYFKAGDRITVWGVRR